MTLLMLPFTFTFMTFLVWDFFCLIEFVFSSFLKLLVRPGFLFSTPKP